MRKLIIVLALTAFVSAFAVEVPECLKNHIPDIDWPETYPKGIAGRTIFYAITTDPGPEYFGWDEEAADFIAMCGIIDTYETWYALRIATVEAIMEDFETEPMTVAERNNKSTDLFNTLKAIDVRFMDDGDLCWAKVPSEVQEDYIDYMTE